MWHLLLALNLFSWAYIPEYSLITSEMADIHGRGAYQIVQDVTIKKEAESFTVRETWTVLNESTMVLKLDGRGPLRGLIDGTILFDEGRRVFYDGSAIRTQKLGDEWIEPLFHFRSSKYFRNRMVSLKVAPPESLKERPSLAIEGEPNYQPPSFIRLARTGGAIAWAVGRNPKEGDSPTAWIEQDQFVIRKFKIPGQFTMKADDYKKVDTAFLYPQTRYYNFGPYVVQVRTARVQSLGRVSGSDDRFKKATLSKNKDILKLPELAGLSDFYQRFR
ncbi:MAG: hypothetical protein AB7F86_03505 [Bdellovibrionales bacterium]